MQSYDHSSDSPSHSPRHFYRCIDCLSVVATETKIQPVQIPPAYVYSFCECGACGGRIEYTGEVERDRLQKTAFTVPCDSRCTNAFGPRCDCQCGGANHGSHRVVEVVVEVGKVPRLIVPEDAKVKGEAYRALVQAVQNALQTRYGRVFQAKRNGEYLNVADWFLYVEGQRLQNRIHEAREFRSHVARNKKLNAILADITPTPAAMGVCA